MLSIYIIKLPILWLGLLGNPVQGPAPAPATSKVQEKEIKPRLAEQIRKPSTKKRASTPMAHVNTTAPVVAVGKQLSANVNSADAIVARVQENYRTTEKFTAKFRQTYTNKTFGRKTHNDGNVWLKKKGKMRWDYYGKKKSAKAAPRKSFISDGQTLWAVEYDNKQVWKKSLRDDVMPVAVSFLTGTGDLRKDFNVSLDNSGQWVPAGKKGAVHVLKLLPKRPSAAYKELYLVVAGSQVIESIVVEAPSGNINHFQFFDPKPNAAVKDAWFLFDEAAAKKKNFRIKKK